MNKKTSAKTFVRFIIPLIVLFAGLFILIIEPDTYLLEQSTVSTIGVGMYTIGALTFMLIYNHARNPVATDEVILNSSQGLVVYGGFIIALAYENIIKSSTAIIAVSIVMVIGVMISVLFEILETSKE